MKNKGTIKGAVYTKILKDWNKAVLWKDGGHISLPPHEVHEIVDQNVQRIVFVDTKRGRKFTADQEDCKMNAELRQVGQEKQYYIPIQIFKESKLNA